jgi:hypothetical protein
MIVSCLYTSPAYLRIMDPLLTEREVATVGLGRTGDCYASSASAWLRKLKFNSLSACTGNWNTRGYM